MYDSSPYVIHLDHVAEIVTPFGYKCVIIAYLHDIIEDTDITHANIVDMFGEYIADCVYI
jgi:(p)ppGpp synthase/HD superfamily hydrolase